MAKPTSKPDWTVGNPNQATISVEPPSGKKLAGWSVNERPPAQFWNWLLQNIGEWIDHFEEQTDTVMANNQEYDAVVGVNGTHATLADLLADANISAKKNILVVSPQVLTSPVTINQPDMNFLFKPQAVISSSGGNVRGLVLDANRIRISKARFSGFNTAGAAGIEITNGTKYSIISECYFFDSDQNIIDDGDNTILNANVDEV